MSTTENNVSSDAIFVHSIRELGKNELVALRRAFGATLKEASGNALAAFYKSLPKGFMDEEPAFLAATTIAYILHYEGQQKSLAECFINSEIAESRIKALLTNSTVDESGFFHAKFSRLIRYCVQKGNLPYINSIYKSLINWEQYRKTLAKEFYEKYNSKK